jgi:hypothetical protein
MLPLLAQVIYGFRSCRSPLRALAVSPQAPLGFVHPMQDSTVYGVVTIRPTGTVTW